MVLEKVFAAQEFRCEVLINVQFPIFLQYQSPFNESPGSPFVRVFYSLERL